MKFLLVAVATISLPLASPVSAALPEQACVHLDLVEALSGLDSGPGLAIERDRQGLSIVDRASKETILSATCAGLTLRGPRSVVRPLNKQPATTRVVADRDGRRVYSHSVSARGARATVIEPGQVNTHGLHVMAFDNDDVHITDGLGHLVFSVRTTAEGGLVEREGKRYGCGCERRTQPDGRSEMRAL